MKTVKGAVERAADITAEAASKLAVLSSSEIDAVRKKEKNTLMLQKMMLYQ